MIKLSYNIVQVPANDGFGSMPRVTFAEAGVLPNTVPLQGDMATDDGVTLTMAYMAIQFDGWDDDGNVVTGLSCHAFPDTAASVSGGTHVAPVAVAITPTGIRCCVGSLISN
jgi:hypothetical protein